MRLRIFLIAAIAPFLLGSCAIIQWPLNIVKGVVRPLLVEESNRPEPGDMGGDSGVALRASDPQGEKAEAGGQ